jgi:alpha-glucosidase
LNEAYEMVDELRNEELDLTKYFSLRKKFATLTNNPKDYQLFYHTIDGKKVRHDKVHNLFGYNMTRAAKEALDRFDPTQRKLLFSRSSMIGMHRYSGIWTGDNHAWWSHLKLNIQQMPSLDMCGFLYAGADLGGFSGDTNEELMIR